MVEDDVFLQAGCPIDLIDGVSNSNSRPSVKTRRSNTASGEVLSPRARHTWNICLKLRALSAE